MAARMPCWGPMLRRSSSFGLVVAVALIGAIACTRPDEQDPTRERSRHVPSAAGSVPQHPEASQALETLRREETELRARTDFRTLPPSSRAFGANPYAIAAIPSEMAPDESVLFAAVTRGDSEIVVLGRDAKVLARASAPKSPTAVTALSDGRIFALGELEPRVASYRLSGSHLTTDADVPLPGALSPRALAADTRALFVADFWGDRLYVKRLDPAAADTPVESQELCGGPIRLALTERFVAAVCLFDHAVVIFERDGRGLAGREIKRIAHDGPFWGFSLLERGDELFVAAGGVEDHPLDRRDKAFGYVDSFVYLYRLDKARRVERLMTLNTSELGVVTPKVTRLFATTHGVRVTALGYASDAWLEVEWDEASGIVPVEQRNLRRYSGVPGCSDVAFAGSALLCANPLLDAWVELTRTAPASVHPARATKASDPSPTERLGEALFFTTLMAPDATSTGRRSRFTCETCHFEGWTDGRVHHSGRGDIRVSTRPLLGLFNDAPHFSRAHDPDLTSVSNNEFAVANRGNPIDPWFSLRKARFPWLGELGVTAETIEPLELRRALLAFLARFSHTENPLAVRRPEPRTFTEDERHGAEIFRERCVSCHAARLIAQDASKAVPFERWEELVLSPEGPIVWSNGEYAKTGVLPYVDSKGTQTPSLRRLYVKRPYLTNGSARTLEELVREVRFSEAGFWHGSDRPARGEKPLGRDEQRALLAFLRVL